MDRLVEKLMEAVPPQKLPRDAIDRWQDAKQKLVYHLAQLQHSVLNGNDLSAPWVDKTLEEIARERINLVRAVGEIASNIKP